MVALWWPTPRRRPLLASELEITAFGKADRPAGEPGNDMRCGPCPIPRIALRAAPTQRTASPHEMGEYYRDLVLMQDYSEKTRQVTALVSQLTNAPLKYACT